jgi:hypothetical protein
VSPTERSDKLLALVERMTVALEAMAGAGKPIKAQAEAPAKEFARAGTVIPSCPECDAKMLLRTNKTKGNQFWGCPKFPACRGVRELDGSVRGGKRTVPLGTPDYGHDPDDDDKF